MFRYRAGLAWRDLPERFGPWQTAWKRHHRFSVDGTWDQILAALQAEADAVGDIDWRVSVDSSSSRVHHHGATAKRSSEAPMSYTGGKIESQETEPQRRAMVPTRTVGSAAATP